MSEKARNIFALILLALLAVSAFVAGYFANDLVELRRGNLVVSAGDQSELGLFWEAWRYIDANFMGELPDSKARTYGAIRGSLALLDDPYTIFVEPVAREQERQSLQGTFGGIGATLTRPEDGGPIFLEPIPGNPAESAGIQSGDELLAIDGTAVTPEMSVADAANMIRGEKGTTVTLTVRHPGQDEPVEVTIERGDILIPSVTYRVLPENEKIGYIQLTRFSGESRSEMEEALAALLEQDVVALILDLRGNGGGLLDAAVSVADLFLDKGPVLYQQSREEGEQVYSSSNETLAPDQPLLVLVDGGTASAAEILAGALQDRGRAALVGSGPTFGKGSVQLVFDLSDGSSVHVTASRWYTPDRRQLDQTGLQPDILVTVTQEDIDNGRDAVLNQAITELENMAIAGK